MWKLAEDTISQAEIDALADWLRTGPRLTQGPRVRAFEDAWSDWLGTDRSVMVSSGTTANFALIAVAGDLVERTPPRVGVSAVTWSTNVTPSMLLGHEIVVFDVDPRTLGMRPDRVCAAMDRGEIDILFVTHLLGFCALEPEVIETAERNGVLLLEDCCESHGARLGDRKIGTLGRASTFSFYFGHHMSTVEGGMISTDDPEIEDRLRLMRSHGLARESARFEEHVAANPTIDPAFLFVTPGLNFRSTDLHAFLGPAQLDVLDARIEQRNRNLARFLDGAPDWIWKDFRMEGASSFALPLIGVDAEAAARVRRAVDGLGIERRPVVAGNLLAQPFLRDHPVRVDGDAVPTAEHVHAHGIYVGNGHHVTDDMVQKLVEALAEEGNGGT